MILDTVQIRRPDAFYAYGLLRHTRPNLCIDVGAAAGYMAKRMRQAAPDCDVIAFEPFPGNIRFLEERAAETGRMKIVQAAVGAQKGAAQFHVASVVAENQPGMERFPGYSSLGMLLDDKPPPRAGQILDVEVVRLDDLVQERVGMLKIDVQGGEFDVLQGAEKLVAEHGVDMMFIEFDGRDARILHWLQDRGYRLFDSLYSIINSDGRFAKKYLINPKTNKLSTGGTTSEGYVGGSVPRGLDQYAAWLKSAGGFGGYAWTDILAVHEQCAATVLPLLQDVV